MNVTFPHRGLGKYFTWRPQPFVWHLCSSVGEAFYYSKPYWIQSSCQFACGYTIRVASPKPYSSFKTLLLYTLTVYTLGFSSQKTRTVWQAWLVIQNKYVKKFKLSHICLVYMCLPTCTAQYHLHFFTSEL